MLPDIVVIGSMKAGTTSLFRYLASHPDVVPSSVKETNFFTTDEDFNKGLDWYRSLFRQAGRSAIEASPNYTKRHVFPGVPARMQAILPDARLIYLLRDPVDRIVSHYIHNYANGRETRPLSEIVTNPDSGYIQTSRYYFQLQAFLAFYPEQQICLVESERLRNDTAQVVNEVPHGYPSLSASLRQIPRTRHRH